MPLFQGTRSSFGKILRLSKNLRICSKQECHNFLDVLLDDKNGRTIFCDGILNSFYERANESDEKLVVKLTETVTASRRKRKKKSMIDRSPNRFLTMPQSLLSRICTFLSAKDVLVHWGCVNHSFFEITTYPESFEYFSFEGQRTRLKDDPNFALGDILSNVKHLRYDRDWPRVFEIEEMKKVQSIYLSFVTLFFFLFYFLIPFFFPYVFMLCSGESFCGEYQTFCTLPESFCLRLVNLELEDCDISYLHTFLKLLRAEKCKNWNLKCVRFVNVGPFEYSNPLDTEDKVECEFEVNDWLELWVPDTRLQRQIEVNMTYAIDTDIMDDDTIKKVKERIILDAPKAEKFDENELSSIDTDEDVFESKLEMIEFEINAQGFGDYPIKLVKTKLTEKRINSSLGNLRGLAVGYVIVQTVYHFAGNRLLNVIGHQLTSLHLVCIGVQDWELMKKIVECYNDNKNIQMNEFNNETWFPVNLQELCWVERGNKILENQRFWFRFGRQMFPKLERLIIEERFGKFSFYIAMDRIAVLVNNGLRSLYMKLLDVPLESFVSPANGFPATDGSIRQLLSLLAKNIRDHRSIDETKKRDFIVKFEFCVNIDIWKGKNPPIEIEEICRKEPSRFFRIQDECNLLMEEFHRMFDNYALGIKNRFYYFSGFKSPVNGIEENHRKVKKCFEVAYKQFLKGKIFNDKNKSRLFEVDYKIFKKKPTFAFIVKSNNHGKSDYAHTDPKYSYYCSRCKIKPWLE